MKYYAVAFIVCYSFLSDTDNESLHLCFKVQKKKKQPHKKQKHKNSAELYFGEKLKFWVSQQIFMSVENIKKQCWRISRGLNCPLGDYLAHPKA